MSLHTVWLHIHLYMCIHSIRWGGPCMKETTSTLRPTLRRWVVVKRSQTRSVKVWVFSWWRISLNSRQIRRQWEEQKGKRAQKLCGVIYFCLVKIDVFPVHADFQNEGRPPNSCLAICQSLSTQAYRQTNIWQQFNVRGVSWLLISGHTEICFGHPGELPWELLCPMLWHVLKILNNWQFQDSVKAKCKMSITVRLWQKCDFHASIRVGRLRLA